MATQQHIASLITTMRHLPQPIVAAVQGAAAAGQAPQVYSEPLA